MHRRRLTSLLLIPSLTACYAYTVTPRPSSEGESVELFLNPGGRAALAADIGADTRTLSGEVTGVGDSIVTIAVRSSRSIRGEAAEWNGEHVTVALSQLDSTRLRRLSRKRTAVAAAGGIAFIAILRAIFSGTAGESSPPAGPPPTQ